MSFGKIVATLVTVCVVAVGVGVGATWWFMKEGGIATAEAAPARERDNRVYKYVSLDKVIVMLRGEEGEPVPHYLAVDLVFKTPERAERQTREHLPFLRSVAVKALSTLTMDKASRMTVDELTASINEAYAHQYTSDGQNQPFVDVMIGKLLVE
ncbi:MAG TPA: flagellar basal body-associated FliL family protein [Steroidobacter sp.]|uniref:flagellar basal body-associated FliL family protein n=1 Tax=Steroidobacter sp. TaxID=1978227 RepID=UPI002EDB7B39